MVVSTMKVGANELCRMRQHEHITQLPNQASRFSSELWANKIPLSLTPCTTGLDAIEATKVHIRRDPTGQISVFDPMVISMSATVRS